MGASVIKLESNTQAKNEQKRISSTLLLHFHFAFLKRFILHNQNIIALRLLNQNFRFKLLQSFKTHLHIRTVASNSSEKWYKKLKIQAGVPYICSTGWLEPWNLTHIAMSRAMLDFCHHCSTAKDRFPRQI